MLRIHIQDRKSTMVARIFRKGLIDMVATMMSYVSLSPHFNGADTFPSSAFGVCYM